ncbi:MAG TPA: TraE/TraK family type IV conjugative transfer system protein [Thiohalobacter sp.]|nr:TraE/TraK family type IV conjugative transfer system protein [Thiohalobacter sp.]
MRASQYIAEITRLTATNRLLTGLLVVLVILTAVNGYYLNVAVRDHQTHILPLGVDEEYQISARSANEAYLRRMIRYVAALAFNYTPLNVRSQFEELLTLIHPEHYPKYQKTFYATVREVEAVNNFARTFNIQSIEMLRDATVRITGISTRRVEDTYTPERRTYLIDWRIEQGRFWVTGIREANRTQADRNRLPNLPIEVPR